MFSREMIKLHAFQTVDIETVQTILSLKFSRNKFLNAPKSSTTNVNDFVRTLNPPTNLLPKRKQTAHQLKCHEEERKCRFGMPFVGWFRCDQIQWWINTIITSEWATYEIFSLFFWSIFSIVFASNVVIQKNNKTVGRFAK